MILGLKTFDFETQRAYRNITSKIIDFPNPVKNFKEIENSEVMYKRSKFYQRFKQNSDTSTSIICKKKPFFCNQYASYFRKTWLPHCPL